jgi:hypothetical protein
MKAKTRSFQISRGQARAGTPLVALPERGDAERLERWSNSLKDFGADRAAYAAEVNKLWQQARDKFLVIGRYLMRAKAALDHGEYEAMVEADLKLGKNIAWQLKAIAEAVDGGRIEESELPRSYATAHKIVRMDDVALERARREFDLAGVGRPEIERFLWRMEERRQPRLEFLSRQKAKLARRLDALAREQEDVARKLADIEAELGGKLIVIDSVEVGRR